MITKAVAKCDICKSEFPIKMDRRSYYINEEYISVMANFCLSTGEGRNENDIEYETVCHPCRLALSNALKAKIKQLKPQKKGK